MWGDLQVETLGSSPGGKCSMYLTQPGEQEVSNGSGPPCCRRWISSVASSRMVRSAARLVSNTRLTPSRCSAAGILPVTTEPALRPNSSPRDTRMAGATWATTNMSGSLRAFQTGFRWLFSRRAPVGHSRMHWPQ
jgi:hypothetical protein